MKLHQLPLLTLFFVTHSSISMELTSWQRLPKDILWSISALAHNNASMHLVDRQCASTITQENMLLMYPASLSRRDHINFMVKNAKKYNGDDRLIRLGLKTASLCDHKYLSILIFFVPHYSPLFNTITKCEDNPNDEHLKILLPTIISVYRGDPDSINEYKKRTLFTNPKHRERITALHTAVHQRHNEIAELLLIQDPTLLNQRPSYEHAPLDGNEPQIKLIMATPLEVAISKNSLPMCTFLLSFKNIMLDSSLNNLTLLEWTAQNLLGPTTPQNDNNNIEIINLITQKIKQRYGQEKYISFFTIKALHNAMVYGANKLVLFLLEEMKYTLPGATQPLHLAIECNRFALCKEICNHPTTDINAYNENGETPLHIAIRKHHGNEFEYLLKQGANPNIADTTTMTTPIMRLVTSCPYNGYSQTMLELLLEKKALLDAQNISGETALLMVVKRHHQQCQAAKCQAANICESVKLLINKGANPNISDNNGQTAYDYAPEDMKNLLDQYNTSKAS